MRQFSEVKFGKTTISPDTLKALKAASSSEADRWLIDAAVFDSLSKKEQNLITGGNASRVKRRSSRVIDKAVQIVAVHETYRRLAKRNALEEASLLLGGAPLTEAEVLQELEEMERDEEQDNRAYIAWEKEATEQI